MLAPLRVFILVGALALILADGTARAQSDPPPKNATSSATQTSQTPKDQTPNDRPTLSDKERIANYMAQCLNDWDAATHMTKPDWARVCKRVIDNRAKFLRETGYELPKLR